MIEIIFKQSRLEINISYLKFLKRNFCFDINQATLEELIEFDYYLKKDLEYIQYIYKILNRINPKFKIKHFNKIYLEDFEQIIQFVTNNYCKDFYNNDNSNTAKDWKQNDEVPFYATIKWILDNSNETLSSLLKLNREQIKNILIEWSIYWNNEKSEKWKLLNKQKKLINSNKNNKNKIDNSLDKIKKDRNKIWTFLKNNY